MLSEPAVCLLLCRSHLVLGEVSGLLDGGLDVDCHSVCGILDGLARLVSCLLNVWTRLHRTMPEQVTWHSQMIAGACVKLQKSLNMSDMHSAAHLARSLRQLVNCLLGLPHSWLDLIRQQPVQGKHTTLHAPDRE